VFCDISLYGSTTRNITVSAAGDVENELYSCEEPLTAPLVVSIMNELINEKIQGSELQCVLDRDYAIFDLDMNQYLRAFQLAADIRMQMRNVITTDDTSGPGGETFRSNSIAGQ
jgi:hypothetical protein